MLLGSSDIGSEILTSEIKLITLITAQTVLINQNIIRFYTNQKYSQNIVYIKTIDRINKSEL